MTHENVSFNTNGTLSTIPNHPLLWRGDLSEGRQEDDIFYLPNIALLVSKSGFYVGNDYIFNDSSRCMYKYAQTPTRLCRIWEKP